MCCLLGAGEHLRRLRFQLLALLASLQHRRLGSESGKRHIARLLNFRRRRLVRSLGHRLCHHLSLGHRLCFGFLRYEFLFPSFLGFRRLRYDFLCSGILSYGVLLNLTLRYNLTGLFGLAHWFLSYTFLRYKFLSYRGLNFGFCGFLGGNLKVVASGLRCRLRILLGDNRGFIHCRLGEGFRRGSDKLLGRRLLRSSLNLGRFLA